MTTPAEQQQIAREVLHEASADLDALRAQAEATIGGSRPEDGPVRDAWTIALTRFRAACSKYVEVFKT